jgi:hypothetical protein
MTRSYGGGPPERRKDQDPELREGDQSKPAWERKLDSLSRYSTHEETAVEAVKVDFGKRLVAGMVDLTLAYLIGQVLVLVPLINDVVSLQLVMVVVLIFRDWFYEGRGVGKNLMGLQVVDMRSGRPCSMFQSVKRNIIMFGAPFVLYIIIAVLQILRLLQVPHIEVVAGPTLQIINGIGFLFIIAAIPYEAYRAYNREDGRRFGDQFAGTTIVEAPMDFSHLIPPN